LIEIKILFLETPIPADINEEIHQQILEKLSEGETSLKEERFESIGPSIGRELKDKTKIVVGLSLSAMVLYIALAFRKVQRPLKSWRYGLVSLVALSHDILIPLGVFAVLGRFYGFEISTPVITALLAVVGYSINNVVVVFDRVRENLLKGGSVYEDIVNASLNQTFSRQLNTSLTTLFTVVAIFLFGGATLKTFSLALMLGIASGAYSSFFIAAPLMVSWHKWTQRKVYSRVGKGG